MARLVTAPRADVSESASSNCKGRERASSMTSWSPAVPAAKLVDLPVVGCFAHTRRGEYMPRAAILLATFLILVGCSREEAIERLKRDLPVDSIEIAHARFPCRSPEMHFFGYRFRAELKGKGVAIGDICWNFLTREWTWRMLPEYQQWLLNTHK